MWPDKPLNSRQQRRSRNTQGNGFTSRRQVIQHVPFLLAQGHHCSQNTFHKQTAIFALCSITAATPDHTSAQGSFSSIIGGFNTFPIDERPQSLLNFEDILAGTTSFTVFEQCADLEQADDFPSNGLHRSLEFGPGERSVTDAMPNCDAAH